MILLHCVILYCIKAYATDNKTIYFGCNFSENLCLKKNAQVTAAVPNLIDIRKSKKTCNSVFGKKIGGDILCNKKTYMLITALNRADESDKEALLHWIGAADFVAEEKIAAVTSIYNRIGMAGICEEEIEKYYARGLEFLNKVSVDASLKENLRTFVCRLMNRKL